MKKLMIVIGIFTVIAGVVWVERAWSTMRVNARTAKFNEDVDNLFSALQKYKERDRKSTRLNSSHSRRSRMPSSA